MDFDIVIPTLNGARWLGQLLDAYRKWGVEPLYAVDARSDDDTLALLRGRNARIVLIHQNGLYVENGVFAQISRHVERDWILRLDDDEFPSRGLLQWAEKTMAPPDVLSWYLSRLTLYRHDGRIRYSRVKTHYHAASNGQLIDRNTDFTATGTWFTSMIFTLCGFKLETSHFAPASAIFLHLDPLLRNPAERLAKLRRYEKIKPRSSWKFAYHYLPDLFPAVQNPAALKVRDFEALIASLPAPPRQSEIPAERELRTAQLAASRYLRAWHLRQRRISESGLRGTVVRALSRKALAEFLCTSARALHGRTWIPHRLPSALQKIGGDLYWRASLLETRDAPRRGTSNLPAKAQSRLGKGLN